MANILYLTVTLFFGSFLIPVKAEKIDCYPIADASKERCEAIGCLWSPVNEGSSRSSVGEPWCYFPDDYVGYHIDSIDVLNDKIILKRIAPSVLKDDIQELSLELKFFKSSLRLRILDSKNNRFEPELPVTELGERDGGSNDLQYKIHNGRLIIKRVSTNAEIFNTDLRKLIYSDKFIQIDSKLNSPFVYGLGEHYGDFLKLAADSYKAYSFYNTDRLPLPIGQRSYGGFPFYINFDSDNHTNAHGVYLRNSNAMDIVLTAKQSISFRPIGGIIDLIFFVGPTPNDVISQYQHAVGLPNLPPRWALGFHLCRYNYNTLEKTKLVWKRTRDAKIPFDAQWNDIDYMDRHNDFTYDQEKYDGLPDFVAELHNQSMHYMILFDPGLSQEADYYPYTLGEKMDIFVKNATNQTLVGKVWNDSGRTVFPDFSNPLSTVFWSRLFQKFYQTIEFDGAWIDMNDISNFVDGSLDGCPQSNYLEQVPYKPGGSDLRTHSLCLSAKHRAGFEYDLHNLYSFYEAIATFKALQATQPEKRPFIISRSTGPGQGVFSGHWSGDVRSDWEYLKWSIPSLLEHTMYGFSMMGSDICGFGGNTSPELCARWSTLGAFYSFSRNHNDDVSIDQDPVALGPEVVEANRNAFNKKYSLIPYMYSLIYRAHLFGEPAIRSVTFEYYKSDPEVLKVEYQFLWGKGIMVSPVVDQGTHSKNTYLPKGRWYETNLLPVKEGSVKIPKLIDSKGEWHETSDISLTDLPLFYRGGTIVPIYAEVRPTVPETVKQPIALEVSLCHMNKSHGELFLDDGETKHDDKYNYAVMTVNEGRLTVSLTKDNHASMIEFGRVLVYGVTSHVEYLKINNKPANFKQFDHVLVFDFEGRTASIGRDLIAEWA